MPIYPSKSQPGTRWVRVKYFREFMFPQLPACYAIFAGSKLLYVGSSKNIRARFSSHQIQYGYINGRSIGPAMEKEITIAYRPSVKYGDWLMVELRLLRKLRPPVNSVGNGGRRFMDYAVREVASNG